MKNTLLPIIGLALILLVSGCTTQTNDGVGAPASDTQTTAPETNENEVMEEETIPEPENNTPPVPPQEIQETVDKLEAPYACNDQVLVQAFKEIFGSGTEILRKPVPFGKTINFTTCNVTQSGSVMVQLEFHETTALESALDSMEDEARQIELQLFESVKSISDIGEKGYSFYSERTNEHRHIFVDSDPDTPVFVMVRSLPGSDVEESLVRKVAETLEKLI